MPCGKKRLVKNWDKPKDIKIIKPSRYQQNEPSVKKYWRNAVKEMELVYKDDKFWETQCDTVRNLLQPDIFERIAKIFNLPLTTTAYKPPESDSSSILSSNQFYKRFSDQPRSRPIIPYSEQSVLLQSESEEEEAKEEEVAEEEESDWSSFSEEDDYKKTHKSVTTMVKSISRMDKDFSLNFSKSKSSSRAFPLKSRTSQSMESLASTNDDVEAHLGSKDQPYESPIHNPFFDMLYCNESETDMIKWPSNYRQKKIEFSASDEFSKKAELLSKKIAMDFFDWWTDLGSLEHKSEIKRAEDIEDLFQVWFDEHASRSLKLDPKILPCVLPSIAKYCAVPKMSCPNMLKRHIAADIKAETSPAHTRAFNSSLPNKMKHIPPSNNTKEVWHCLKIPQDLKTMTAVWEDIGHLTSTKAFREYLTNRPHLPMPPCFMTEKMEEKKKQLFVVPSDYLLVRPEKSADEVSQADLSIPVSRFNLEVKEVLSKLLRD